jgi:S1-C subfamily serine protease
VVRGGRASQVQVQLGEFEQPEQRVAQTPAATTPADLLGFRVGPVPQELVSRLDLQGAMVTAVVPNTPAFEQLGEGTVIRRMNGQEIRNPADFERLARRLQPGDVVSLIVRDPESESDRIAIFRTRR